MKSNARILVIDDERVVCESCKKVLAEEGYQVTTSTDGEEGLDRAKSGHFDAVLLDLRMPRKSGLEVLHGIREHKPQTAVVMITAYPTADSAMQSMRLGARDYLLKPFTPDELRLKVQDAIRVTEERAVATEEVPEAKPAEPAAVPLPAKILVAGAWEHTPALQFIARREGTAVEIVGDTDEILEGIRSGETEMLILGLEVFAEHSHNLIPAIRRIREDLSIIVVSSEPSFKLQDKARAEGIAFYLVEPFGTEELKAVIRGAVSQTPFPRGDAALRSGAAKKSG